MACCIPSHPPQRCNAPLFIPKLLLKALTRPQEVHWTQSIITLTTSRCQAFFNMRLSSFPIQDGFYGFRPLPNASMLVLQPCSTKYSHRLNFSYIIITLTARGLYGLSL